MPGRCPVLQKSISSSRSHCAVNNHIFSPGGQSDTLSVEHWSFCVCGCVCVCGWVWGGGVVLGGCWWWCVWECVCVCVCVCVCEYVYVRESQDGEGLFACIHSDVQHGA